MSKKVKIFGIVVIVIAIVIFASSFLGSKKNTTAPKSTSPLSSSVGVIPLPGSATSSKAGADEFSAILASVKNITIDTSLFDNPAYKMLRDFPVSLGSDVVGRTNPFAPVGTDIGGGIPEDVAVQTLQTGKITGTTAEFGAQVTVNDTVPTSIVFEYGTSDTFGSVTPTIVFSKSGTVLYTASRLLPQTTYYVRAIAVRGSNTTTANTTTFTTTKK